MKLINSVNESHYKTVDTVFISEYKWEFLSDKYRIIADEDIWEELEDEYNSDEYTDVLYGDVNAHSCLEILQSGYNYKEIEQLFKSRKITLYTNENKHFHILAQN